MLELTDGTMVVGGMEYRPAPNLSVSLSPGTKVRLKHLGFVVDLLAVSAPTLNVPFIIFFVNNLVLKPALCYFSKKGSVHYCTFMSACEFFIMHALSQAPAYEHMMYW